MIALLLLACAARATAESASVWQMQTSGTTASLRGIQALSEEVAWASGTGGTVLRTLDGGAHWLPCAVPDAESDGKTLDFRGVQAWDAETAIVMASGPGGKSRLYKTSDGCRTWKLLLKNPDKEGFWDAIRFDSLNEGTLLGDPVNGAFVMWVTMDGGNTWKRQQPDGLKANPLQQGAFAASNSSMILESLAHRYFVSGGTKGAYFFECHGELQVGGHPENVDCFRDPVRIPLATGAEGAGAFSLGSDRSVLIVVGGDYTKPNEIAGTAAYTLDGGQRWLAAVAPPHGYRSTVQWFGQEKVWITAGTNGSDWSNDDGRSWHVLDEGNWNALSVPYIVGPKGRIARIDRKALQHVLAGQ